MQLARNMTHETASIPDISDGALMTRLAGGDLSALEPLYNRHGQRIGSLLLRVQPAMSPPEAEELCQEVFLTLAETAVRYREQGKLRSWITGIAVKKARAWGRGRWLRGRLMREQIRPHPAFSATTRADQDQRMEAKQEIQLALESLSPKLREVLVLHAIEGISGPEIGEALGISSSAVWVRLHRAREQMRAALESAGARHEH